jgi:hypothetical protein
MNSGEICRLPGRCRAFTIAFPHFKTSMSLLNGGWPGLERLREDPVCPHLKTQSDKSALTRDSRESARMKANEECHPFFTNG